jgi:AcrR family transcriptional regulator
MTLRADAQRNLDRLLEAAGECFAESGVDASIDEIARRAGVGHGTVFRRFPTKDALVAAVMEGNMRALTAVAVDAREEPGGFERFVRYAAAAYAQNRALIEGITRCQKTASAETLVAAVEELVGQAQTAGEVRTDVSVADVLALIPTASRYPDVILDGLRPARA